MDKEQLIAKFDEAESLLQEVCEALEDRGVDLGHQPSVADIADAIKETA